ncbi:MAG TPA: hypothetical protein VFE30_02900 [Anaeromyxobacteraceae bacterium]|jgi:hypothetical protein|nr:hypothetical protein [Anaeromyxobacteraceae bacterium]
MKKARWSLLLPLASAVVFAAAAAPHPFVYARLARGELSGRDRKAILDTVRLFDRIYEDFYASGGGAAMIDAFPATKNVKHHVFRDVGFLRDEKLVLVYDLADLTPIDVKQTGADTAEALVYEEWNYLYQHAADRSTAANLKGMGQGFRYRLRQERGRWIVTGWDFEDVKPTRRDKGFVY